VQKDSAVLEYAKMMVLERAKEMAAYGMANIVQNRGKA
jgi:hypothetical protein